MNKYMDNYMCDLFLYLLVLCNTIIYW